MFRRSRKPKPGDYPAKQPYFIVVVLKEGDPITKQFDEDSLVESYMLGGGQYWRRAKEKATDFMYHVIKSGVTRHVREGVTIAYPPHEIAYVKRVKKAA